jgi:predicted nucleotidyltransferase
MSKVELPSRIFQALASVSKWLNSENVPHAIIGGIAISLLTEPRATQDIDLTIWIEDTPIDALLETALLFDFVSRIENPTGFAAQARILLLHHRESGVAVDLSLGALPFEKEMIDSARALTISNIEVRVADPENLIISKAIPMRPNDVSDIDKLLTYYPDVDFERIRKVVSEFQVLLDRPEYIHRLEDLLQRHPQRKSV